MDDQPGIDKKKPEEKAPKEEVPAIPLRRALPWLLVPLLLALCFGIWGHWTRYAAAKDTQQQTADFVPTVRVGKAKREDGPIKVTLPGETQAFDLASIYARATGYIAERRVDIGSPVKAGDLLVRISSPDIDAQLAQGKAQLEQARASMAQAQAQLQQSQANVKLANTTNKRTSTLAGEGYASRQDADNSGANVQVQNASVAAAQAAVQVAKANIDAQIATVQRLQQLAAYELVTAPFDGVVTARNIDLGDLVSADASSAAPMFVLARDDTLRVAVQVPQSEAVPLKDGLAAEITVPEMAGRSFKAMVARSSVALNDTSRTMLVQVDLDNSDHTLHPGLYVNVTFDVPRDQPGVVVPDEALVFNAAGEQVAVVQQDQTVSIRKVSILRDRGTEAELHDGLKGDETLVLSPPTDLADGDKIKVDDGKDKQQQAQQ